MMGDPTGCGDAEDYLRLADLQRRNLSKGEVKPSVSLFEPLLPLFPAVAGDVVDNEAREPTNGPAGQCWLEPIYQQSVNTRARCSALFAPVFT
jgi:hypothetical protein